MFIPDHDAIEELLSSQWVFDLTLFYGVGAGKKKPSSLDKKFDQVLESRNNNPLDSLAVWVKSQDTRNIMRHWKKNPPEQSVRRRPTAAILYYVELCPTQTNKREKKGHLLWRLGHPQIPAHDGRSTKPYKKTQKRFQDKASGGNADPLQRNRHHHHQQHRTQSKKKTRLLSFPFFFARILHHERSHSASTPPVQLCHDGHDHGLGGVLLPGPLVLES